MSGHFTLLPCYWFQPYSVLEHEAKPLDFSLWKRQHCLLRPAQLGNLVYLQLRPGKTSCSKWLEIEISPSTDRVEGDVSQNQLKDGRALLHSLSSNPAEMLNSLKITGAKTVPFFFLASSFPPFVLETHYPLRGSSI